MKTSNPALLSWAALAVALASVTACSRPQPLADAWQPPKSVRIEGKQAWQNVFASWMAWHAGTATDGTAGLLVRDGDWLAGKDSILVYRATDGNILRPTIEQGMTRLGKTVVGLSLDDGGREWLEQATAQELAAVRIIGWPEKLTDECLPALRRLAAANPQVNLLVPSTATLRQATPLFRPRTLFAKEGDAAGFKLLSAQTQLETLVITVGQKAPAAERTGAGFEFLRNLPRLRRLEIMDCDFEKFGALPSSLTSLRSLHVRGSEFRDLASLGQLPASLEELVLEGNKNNGEIDLSGLARFPNLKTLILTEGRVRGLSALDGLDQLQWVGLSGDITQEQFAGFIAAHPKLKILELVACSAVTDFTPLKNLRGLESLIFTSLGEKGAASEILPKNLEVLRSLKSLRFVGLPTHLFEKSPAQVAEIQKALPDALVVPVKPFCLGSGWILLLPAVAVGAMLARSWRRHSAPRHPPHD